MSEAVLYTVRIIINIYMVSVLKELRLRRQRRRHAREAENAEMPDIMTL